MKTPKTPVEKLPNPGLKLFIVLAKKAKKPLQKWVLKRAALLKAQSVRFVMAV